MVSRTSPLRSTVLSTSVSVLVLQVRTTSPEQRTVRERLRDHGVLGPGLQGQVNGHRVRVGVQAWRERCDLLDRGAAEDEVLEQEVAVVEVDVGGRRCRGP
jgi:hypothetical protein